jgi:lysophospholipase L1-like esterase
MARKSSWWLRGTSIGVAVVGAMLAVVVGAGADGSPPAPQGFEGWVGTWATGNQPLGAQPISEYLVGQSTPTPISLSNVTLREITHISAGGRAVRVRLDNTFGGGPLLISDLHLGVEGSGAAIQPGTDRALTFAGDPSVTVAQGAQAFSDPVRLDVGAQSNLAVSLFVPTNSALVTGHHNAKQAAFLSTAGDHAADPTATPYTSSPTDWFWLSGVDVLSQSTRGAVVAIGDSITNGAVSTFNGNNRWPDYLARRLLQTEARRSVLNEGIDGAQLLTFRSDCCPAQEAALASLDREVIAQAGVTHVIVLLGTNDLGFGVPAPPIIAGLEQLAAQLHSKGIAVVGGTVTPFQGSVADPQNRNDAARDAVNQFVRTSDVFDGFVDFDRAVRDPANPERLLPAFDSGDHLHPNDAGDQAMGNAVRLELLR